MLIKYYAPHKHKILNNESQQAPINNDKQIKAKYNNLDYNTESLSVFDNIPTEEIIKIHKDQLQLAKAELDTHIKYGFISQGAYDKTLKQYNDFIFMNNSAFLKENVLAHVNKNIAYDDVFVSSNKSPSKKQTKPLSEIQQELKKNNQRGVSRSAIRETTGYSFNPYIEHYDKPIYIEWQHKLLEDTNDLIIVNGSRQMGKCAHYKAKTKLFNGQYKMLKDLEYDDILLGSNYQPIKITQLIKGQIKPSYKIIYDNGHEEIFSSEHRIPIDINFSNESGWDVNKTDNVEKYYNIEDLFILKEKGILQDNKIPFIFNTTNINNDFSEETMLLYGYFLGNGCNNANLITGNHPRLLNIKEYIVTPNKEKRNYYRYYIHSFKQANNLEGLGLALDKFIDKRIFQQSNNLKFKVLDGLLNTDGYLYVQKNNSPKIEYCSISKELIDDIFLLCLELGITTKKRTKKIKSNFSSNNEFAYYLDIQDINSLKIILDNVNLEDKLNYEEFKNSIYSQIENTHRCSRIGTIPLSAKKYIDNSSRKNKLPSYNFQRDKILNGTFTGIDEYLKYSWHSIKNIEYVGEQEVVSIGVDSDDELFFLGGSLTHNSYTIAEKSIEESFLPNNDTLVGGFTTKTTDIIKRYILKYIAKFNKGKNEVFTHFKSERCVVNNLTGTTVYFRTLADDAQSILGMTLKNIIVDEAQLVDEFVYEEVLIPTLATTGGKMTLIFTPGRKRSGYVFKKIMEYKKGLLTDTSFYEIDITKNPFVKPKHRANIMARKHEPAIRRQRFCEWNDGGDEMFQPKKTNQVPILSNEGFYVLGIDPARLKDRSGYSIHYINNGKICTLYSGFVPDIYKKDWGLQAIFYKGIIEKYKDQKLYTVMDISGVGDGVAKIFQDRGIRLSMKIRYTSGVSKTFIQSLNEHRVGKSLLINNTLDLIQEETIEIFEPMNKELIEELGYIQETETKSQNISFETQFFDDITNSTLISNFLIASLGLLSRKNIPQQSTVESSHKYMDAIENPKNVNIQINESSIW